MKKNGSKKENSIKTLSRAQTAKIRKNLEKTFFNIKSKKSYNPLNRPVTSFHENKLSQLYLPPTEYNNENKMETEEANEYRKAHLNEINNQNLFTEKLWEKNNLEKNEDYSKNLAYKKLIMRARLLKAMKTNIVLRKREFDEYNSKYYKGNRLLSEKLKNKKRKGKDDSSSDDDEDNKDPERPNFNTMKHPDIFSEYEYTSLFQDYYCSPIELIKKIFNYDEQKIIKLDPLFFRLNKGPFIGVQNNMGFSLKDKINEEDRIQKQKMEKLKEINKRFIYIKRKQNRRNTQKTEAQKESTKELNNISNDFNINISNNISNDFNIINKKKSQTQSKYFFPNNTNNKNKSKNKTLTTFNNFFPINKHKSSKKQKKLKLDLSEINNSKKKELVDFNFNTYYYDVYLEMKKNQKKKNMKLINYKYLYKDEEKIKDKKKRLSMEELLEMYNERKKLYLDDLSYNRKKNNYKYEKLRIKKHEENKKEEQKKENLRKILVEIEENYKLYQK